MRRAFALLFVSSAALAAGDPAADRIYERATQHLQQKSYGLAADEFREYRDAVDDTEGRHEPRYVDAYYYEAEARYLGDEKYEAHELYDHILKTHKNYPHLAEVIGREYEIGTAFIEGKAKKPFLGVFRIRSESLGTEILKRLIESYQEKYFDDAQYQVAERYFRDHDWRRAADAYLALEEQFRESPLAGIAQYQRAVCYLKMSRGYRYDPTYVAKAEEVLLDYVKKNPTGSRIKEAEKALEEIRAGRATLYLENARFYLSREKRPRAALVYLEAILRETPEAPSAAKVQELLAEVEAQARDGDPRSADLARDLLSDVERRKSGEAPARAPVPASTPPAREPEPGRFKGVGVPR